MRWATGANLPMHTAAPDTPAVIHHLPVMAANDPIAPIRDYNFPIPPYKHPPTPDDFERNKRHHEEQEDEAEEPKPTPPRNDGHIDDFA